MSYVPVPSVYYCTRCDVEWNGVNAASRCCWNCGGEGTEGRLSCYVFWHGSATWFASRADEIGEAA